MANVKPKRIVNAGSSDLNSQLKDGILGLPIQASAHYIYLFVLFGAFVDSSGAGKFFVDFARCMAGRYRGGPAKVSIVSSALIGTASASSVANVVIDGVFNIPLMKASGFRASIAGAIEAMNSTGGQIMPPVMGAGAFLMAEILGIPYARVATAAHLFIFYFACISALTPPVALASFAAAAIANAKSWEVGWQGMRFAIAGFLIPYMFVLGPAMVLVGDWWDIALAGITGFFGTAALAASVQGWLLTRCVKWERIALFIAAICLIKPGWVSDLVGAVIMAGIIVLQPVRRKNSGLSPA